MTDRNIETTEDGTNKQKQHEHINVEAEADKHSDRNTAHCWLNSCVMSVFLV